MNELTKAKRAVLEAIAKQLGAKWEWGSRPGDAYLRVGRKRIAVDVGTRNRRFRRNAAPRLRFDKVVVELMDRMKDAVDEIVPGGTTILLTVTAPIRRGSKTAAALEDKISALVRRRSPGREVTATIHGNRVRIRVVRHEAKRAPKLIGFVHNPDPDAPLILLDTTSNLLAQLRSSLKSGIIEA